MRQRRILIIRPDRIGDVVLTTPLIRAVKRSFPGAFIGVMVNSVSGVLLRHDPHIDLLITDDPSGKDSGRAGFWRQVATLRRHRFDTGLMPLPRERHAWMMFLAGIKRRIGVGGKIYQWLTATRTVSRNKYIPLRHEADYVMDLGRRIGVTDDDITTELYLTEQEKQSARAFFTDHGLSLDRPIIGINPSSNKSVPNWTPERYVELCTRLEATRQLFINVGINDPVMERLFDRFRERHIVYSGTDLRELMALTGMLSLLVSSSTGTQHIAAALKVPTLTLFCPLPACSHRLWGSLGNRAEVIEPEQGYCQGRCPGDPKVCTFDEISIQTVVDRIIQMSASS
ncbi:MAG: glycosyltransferase family 9 protein [Bacteroidetes bacterium]|nr:glycosyltransferase family 9 protein [Bacteroidota bacterium]